MGLQSPNPELVRQKTDIEGINSLKAQLTGLGGFQDKKGPQVASKRGAGL